MLRLDDDDGWSLKSNQPVLESEQSLMVTRPQKDHSYEYFLYQMVVHTVQINSF